MSLILTRRVGETICIGNDVKITVVAVNGGQVKLACNAPKAVEIDRQEIHERKQYERRSNAAHQQGAVSVRRPARACG